MRLWFVGVLLLLCAEGSLAGVASAQQSLTPTLPSTVSNNVVSNNNINFNNINNNSNVASSSDSNNNEAVSNPHANMNQMQSATNTGSEDGATKTTPFVLLMILSVVLLAKMALSPAQHEIVSVIPESKHQVELDPAEWSSVEKAVCELLGRRFCVTVGPRAVLAVVAAILGLFVAVYYIPALKLDDVSVTRPANRPEWSHMQSLGNMRASLLATITFLLLAVLSTIDLTLGAPISSSTETCVARDECLGCVAYRSKPSGTYLSLPHNQQCVWVYDHCGLVLEGAVQAQSRIASSTQRTAPKNSDDDGLSGSSDQQQDDDKLEPPSMPCVGHHSQHLVTRAQLVDYLTRFAEAVENQLLPAEFDDAMGVNLKLCDGSDMEFCNFDIEKQLAPEKKRYTRQDVIDLITPPNANEHARIQAANKMIENMLNAPLGTQSSSPFVVRTLFENAAEDFGGVVCADNEDNILDQCKSHDMAASECEIMRSASDWALVRYFPANPDSSLGKGNEMPKAVQLAGDSLKPVKVVDDEDNPDNLKPISAKAVNLGVVPMPVSGRAAHKYPPKQSHVCGCLSDNTCPELSYNWNSDEAQDVLLAAIPNPTTVDMDHVLEMPRVEPLLESQGNGWKVFTTNALYQTFKQEATGITEENIATAVQKPHATYGYAVFARKRLKVWSPEDMTTTNKNPRVQHVLAKSLAKLAHSASIHKALRDDRVANKWSRDTMLGVTLMNVILMILITSSNGFFSRDSWGTFQVPSKFGAVVYFLVFAVFAIPASLVLLIQKFSMIRVNGLTRHPSVVRMASRNSMIIAAVVHVAIWMAVIALVAKRYGVQMGVRHKINWLMLVVLPIVLAVPAVMCKSSYGVKHKKNLKYTCQEMQDANAQMRSLNAFVEESKWQLCMNGQNSFVGFMAPNSPALITLEPSGKTATKRCDSTRQVSLASQLYYLPPECSPNFNPYLTEDDNNDSDNGMFDNDFHLAPDRIPEGVDNLKTYQSLRDVTRRNYQVPKKQECMMCSVAEFLSDPFHSVTFWLSLLAFLSVVLMAGSLTRSTAATDPATALQLPIEFAANQTNALLDVGKEFQNTFSMAIGWLLLMILATVSVGFKSGTAPMSHELMQAFASPNSIVFVRTIVMVLAVYAFYNTPMRLATATKGSFLSLLHKNIPASLDMLGIALLFSVYMATSMDSAIHEALRKTFPSVLDGIYYRAWLFILMLSLRYVLLAAETDTNDIKNQTSPGPYLAVTFGLIQIWALPAAMYYMNTQKLPSAAIVISGVLSLLWLTTVVPKYAAKGMSVFTPADSSLLYFALGITAVLALLQDIIYQTQPWYVYKNGTHEVPGLILLEFLRTLSHQPPINAEYNGESNSAVPLLIRLSFPIAFFILTLSGILITSGNMAAADSKYGLKADALIVVGRVFAILTIVLFVIVWVWFGVVKDLPCLKDVLGVIFNPEKLDPIDDSAVANAVHDVVDLVN